MVASRNRTAVLVDIIAIVAFTERYTAMHLVVIYVRNVVMLALYMTKRMKLNFSALAVGHKSTKFAGKN